jgi:hypothetical protein
MPQTEDKVREFFWYHIAGDPARMMAVYDEEQEIGVHGMWNPSLLGWVERRQSGKWFATGIRSRGDSAIYPIGEEPNRGYAKKLVESTINSLWGNNA